MARSLGPFARAGILAGVLAVLVLAALPVAWRLAGPEAMWSPLVAGLLCLVACGTAILISPWFDSPDRVLGLVAAGMFLRMGIPLLATLAIVCCGGVLVETGMVYYLAAFYPVALGVETWLDVLRLGPLEDVPADSNGRESPQA